MDGGWWMVDRRYWATDSEPVSIVVGPHLAPISVRNDMTIRPAGLPPMLTSKNTFWVMGAWKPPASQRVRRCASTASAPATETPTAGRKSRTLNIAECNPPKSTLALDGLFLSL